MYPAVIIAAMIGEGFLMMFFILPRLSSVFLSLNMDLPLATEIILKLGSFIGENTLLVLILAIILGGIMAFLFIYPRTRRAITQSLGRLPAVRKMMNEIDIARFSRTLAILLKSGVPIIQSLDVSANSLAQPKWKEAAKTFSARVAKGESLADVLLDDKSKFPVVLAQAIRTGEETGSMDVVLEELAEFYEREVDYSLKRLTSLLEPVLMLLIGVAVGVMVILMVTPIYSIVGGLDKAL
jgi:type IV pilus assembly protein PilC